MMKKVRNSFVLFAFLMNSICASAQTTYYGFDISTPADNQPNQFTVDIAFADQGRSPIAAYESTTGEINVLRGKSQIWSPVGTLPVGAVANYVGLEVCGNPANSEIFLLTVTDAGVMEMHRFDGTSWATFSLVSGLNTNTSKFYGIAVSPSGQAHVVYAKTNGDVVVEKFTGSTFTQVGNVLATNLNCSAFDLAFNASGNPIVSAVDLSAGDPLFFEFSGVSVWNSAVLPGANIVGPNTSIHLLSDGNPVFYCVENDGGLNLNAYKFNGSTWVNFESSNPIRTGLGSANFDADKHPTLDRIYFILASSPLFQSIFAESTSSDFVDITGSYIVNNSLFLATSAAGYPFFGAIGGSGQTRVSAYCDLRPSVGIPMDVEVCVGASANFTANALGNSPLTYEWFENDILMPGQTGTSLTIPVASIDRYYYVEVTDGCALGSVSAPANLRVDNGPIIQVPPPKDKDMCIGDSDNLSAVVSSVVAPISYQWKKDGVNFLNGTPNLNFGTVSAFSAGDYTLTVSNACGSNTSAITKVRVFAPATVTAGADQVECGADLPFQVTGNSTNGSVVWSTLGDGQFVDPTLILPQYIPGPGDIGAGSVILNVGTTNIGNCVASFDSKTITLVLAPDPFIATINPSACETFAFNIALASSVTNASSFTWTASGAGSFTPSNTSANPTYSITATDRSNGSVVFTLSALGAAPCPAITDQTTLTIEKVPSISFPNPDSTLCGEQITLSNVVAQNLIGYGWETDGTGSFIPSSGVANPIYLISPDDVIAGGVQITLSSLNNLECPSTSATFNLTVSNSGLPTLDVGADQLFSSNTLNLNPTVTNIGTVNWVSTGEGSFSDPNATLTVYTNSQADIEAGFAELLCKVRGTGTCADVVLVDTLIGRYSLTGSTLSGNASAEAFARVKLYKELNGFYSLIQETTADGAGDYAFNDLPDGRYIIGSFNSSLKAYYYGDTYDWLASTDIDVLGADILNLNISAASDLRANLPSDSISKYFNGPDIITGIVNLVLPGNLRTANGGGTEKPIQDATVYLLNESGNTRLDVTTTDANGVYSFTGLNGQTYNIAVSYPSTTYETTAPAAVATDGKAGTVNVVNAAMIKSGTISSILSPNKIVTTTYLLYPNPAKEQVHIQSSQLSATIKQAILYDMSGSVLADDLQIKYVNNEELQVSFNKFPKGNYIIKLIDDEHNQTISLPLVIE